MKRALVSVLLLVGVLVLSAAAVLVLVGPARVWAALYGDPDLGPAAFSALNRSDRRNSFLLCPPDFCGDAAPDRIAAIYPAPAAELVAALRMLQDGEPDLRPVHDPAPDDLRYIARSPVLRFPDTVSIRVVPLSPETSTLAIYSRSQVGFSDMGVNRARVEALLAGLDARLASAN